MDRWRMPNTQKDSFDNFQWTEANPLTQNEKSGRQSEIKKIITVGFINDTERRVIHRR